MSDYLKEFIEKEAETYKKSPHYIGGQPLSCAPQIYLKKGYTYASGLWLKRISNFLTWMGNEDYLYDQTKNAWTNLDGEDEKDFKYYSADQLLELYLQTLNK